MATRTQTKLKPSFLPTLLPRLKFMTSLLTPPCPPLLPRGRSVHKGSSLSLLPPHTVLLPQLRVPPIGYSPSCPSMRPSYGAQSFRKRLLQHESPAGPQILPEILLQHGVLCQATAPARSLLLHGSPCAAASFRACPTAEL